MNTKHTPLPWQLTAHKFPNGTYSSGPYIFAPNGPDMARHICELPQTEAGEVNGSFIARAVNSIDEITAQRDALLAACKLMLSTAYSRNTTLVKAACGQCESAIARVEGGAK